MKTSNIIGALQAVAFPSGELDFYDAQYYLATHLNINTFVKHMKGPNGEGVWRPYIEPINPPVWLEFNYIYKSWDQAMWAALVAACVYRLNRKKPISDITELVFEKWKECELKPDMKIKPREKSTEEPKADSQKIKELYEQMFGKSNGDFSFGDKSNPFGSIFGV